MLHRSIAKLKATRPVNSTLFSHVGQFSLILLEVKRGDTNRLPGSEMRVLVQESADEREAVVHSDDDVTPSPLQLQLHTLLLRVTGLCVIMCCALYRNFTA